MFRRSDALPEVVQEAIDIGAETVWAQLGVESSAAAKIAEDNNLPLVMDACIKVEHRRLLG